MGHLTTGYEFNATTRHKMTIAAANAMVADAVLRPSAAPSAPTSPTANQWLYLNGGALYQRPGKTLLEPILAAGVASVMVKGSGSGWIWAADASAFALQQDGTSNYPVNIQNGATSNLLYLNSTGVGIANAAPGQALDVKGAVKSQPTAGGVGGKFIAQAESPMLAFTDLGTGPDEGGSPYHCGFYVSKAACWFGKLTAEGGGADPTNGASVVFGVNAPNNSLVVGNGATANVCIGTETPASGAELTVAGDIVASGDVGGTNLVATGVFYQGANPGLTGTLVVTGAWAGGSSGSRSLSFAGGILIGVT